MEDSKLNKTTVSKLYSSNNEQVQLALEELSISGNSSYVPLLIDILHTSENEQISETITKILSEIKHNDSVPLLIEALESKKYIALRETITRICWENGLDYSNYLTTFVEILVTGKYMEAFEAFTVIENTEGKISETSKDDLINTLKQSLNGAETDRKILLERAINFLPSLV